MKKRERNLLKGDVRRVRTESRACSVVKGKKPFLFFIIIPIYHPEKKERSSQKKLLHGT